jgi:Spy/CpxP family protein refolding chaperone
MKRGWMIVLLLSLGLNVGLGLNFLRPAPPPADPEPRPAMAPHPHGRPGDRPPGEQFLRRRLDRMGESLGLSPDQEQALWTLHREAGPEVLSRRQNLQEIRRELHDFYGAGDVDRRQIRAATRRLSAEQAALDSLVVEIMLREREILTPEQRLEYRALVPLGRDGIPGRLRGPRQGRREVY